MKDQTVRILITGAEGPKWHLYTEALESAGAAAEGGYLPPDDGSYDGLLLAGGRDISPEWYGESHNGAQKCDIVRDRHEYALIKSFVNDRKPILGICRGLQILNVYFGGSLIGDLPALPAHHSDTENVYHTVRIEPDTQMSRLFGHTLRVNSFHHQAVKTVAGDFAATAYSEDGVIEAIEHQNKLWLAVQFHPERMLDPALPVDTAKPLFDHFIALCQQQKAARNT